MDYRTDAPPILRDFLVYHETIQGHSRRTVDEYFLDLRNFFRFLKLDKGRVAHNTPLDQISIDDVDLELVRTVTLSDVYSYMNYLSRDRAVHPNSPDAHYGLSAPARARKVAAIRSFYKYLTSKAKLITENPMQDLDSPHLKKSLPRYLNLEESEELLDSVDGVNQARDYCILTLFLNCGLRISELIGLNITDVRGNQLRVLGKGNKERMLYLNEACLSALSDWITERDMLTLVDQNALFVTLQNRRRISPGGRPQAGEKASGRRRTGQHTVLLPQAAPHRCHPDAPKWRGCAYPSGGAGPRPSEYDPDLYPCG